MTINPLRRACGRKAERATKKASRKVGLLFAEAELDGGDMRWIAILFAAACLAGCDDGDLRGSSVASDDGETYLIIVDDNGGRCGPILVDGKPWTHPIGERGRIDAGAHVVECGTTSAFEVANGTVYTFDYWGP